MAEDAVLFSVGKHSLTRWTLKIRPAPFTPCRRKSYDTCAFVQETLFGCGQTRLGTKLAGLSRVQDLRGQTVTG